MSNIAIKGADTGTGVFTLESPATNTDRTLTLPDEAGTVLTSAGDLPAGNLTGSVPASAMPAGSVLQVVSTTKTDIFSTASTSFVDVTGFSVSITPSSSSSKILIFATWSQSQSNLSGLTVYNLLRDSTNLSQPSTTPAFNGTMNAFQTAASGILPVSLSFLDSPSTTSATIYKIQTRINTGTLYFNGRSPGDSASTATITVMEIAG